jgi:peptide/nickel transport system substrate-binding protein
MEQTGDRSLRITFNVPDRELPLLMGLRPILKKAQWDGKAFDESSLDVPIGSGPYVIEKVDPGKSITYKRNPTTGARICRSTAV